MTEIGRAEYILTTDASGLIGGMSAAERSVMGGAQSMDSRIAGMSGNMAFQLRLAGFALLGFGATVTGVFTAGVNSAADFEESLYKINTLAKLPEKELRALGDQVLDLAVTLDGGGKSAGELSNGLYIIQQAGFQAVEGMDLLELAAKASAAGFTEVETVVQIFTQTLKAYNLDISQAGRVSDILFKTVDIGIISYEELASTFGLVLGNASALKVPLEELGGAIVTLTQRGLSSSRAMTSLNMLLSAFIDPSVKASKAAEDLGFDLSATAITTKGLLGAILDLVNALGLTPEQIEALNTSIDSGSDSFEALAPIIGENVDIMGDLFGNVRSLRAALALTVDQGVLFSEATEAMGIAQQGLGITQEAYNEVAKSTNFQLQLLKNRIEVAAIVLGSVFLPPVAKAAKFLGEIAVWLKELDPRWQKLIGLVTLATGAFTAFTGSGLLFIGFLPALVTGFHIMVAGIGALVAAIVSPVGLGLIASVAALYLAWRNNWFGIRDTFNEVVDTILLRFEDIDLIFQDIENGDWRRAMNRIQEDFRILSYDLFGVEQTIQVQHFWEAMNDKGILVFNAAMDKVRNEYIPAWERITQQLNEDVTPAVRDLWVPLERIFNTLSEMGASVLPVLANFITGTAVPAIENIDLAMQRFAIGLGDRLGPALENVGEVFEWVLGVLNFGLEQFNSTWSRYWWAIEDVLVGVWKVIAGAVEMNWALIQGIIFIGLDLIGGRWGQAWDDFRSMADGFWQGLEKTVEGSLQIILGLLEGALQLVIDTANLMFTALGIVWRAGVDDLVKPFANLGTNIDDAVGDALTFLEDTAHDVVQGFVDGWGAGWKTLINPLLVGLPANIVLGIDPIEILQALVKTGYQMVLGLKKGIEDGVSWVVGQLTSILQPIVDTWNFILGPFKSPSELTTQMGVEMIEGLIWGWQKTFNKADHQLQSMLTALSETLSASKQELLQDLISAHLYEMNRIVGTIKELKDLLATLPPEGILQALVGSPYGPPAFSGALPGGLSEDFFSKWDSLGDYADDVARQIRELWPGMFPWANDYSIQKWLEDLPPSAQPAVDLMIEFLNNTLDIGDALTAQKAGFNSLAVAIKDYVAGVGSAVDIVKALETAMESIPGLDQPSGITGPPVITPWKFDPDAEDPTGGTPYYQQFKRPGEYLSGTELAALAYVLGTTIDVLKQQYNSTLLFALMSAGNILPGLQTFYASHGGLHGAEHQISNLLADLEREMGYDLPKIYGQWFNPPGLATGGWVEKTGLAVVHKGEQYSGVGDAMMTNMSPYLDFRGAVFSGSAEETGTVIMQKLDTWWEDKKRWEFGHGAVQYGQIGSLA